MPEETVVAESSTPVVPVMEVDRGPLVNLTGDQRAEFRRTGELPKVEPPKTEESATSSEDNPPESSESENAGDRTPPKITQEKKTPPTAEARKAKLTEEIRELIQQRDKLKSDVAIPPTNKAEPSPATQQQFTRPKPTADDKDKDGNPKYATYEDFVEELSDWKAEQRWAKERQDQQQQAQARDTQAKVEAAKSRYENFSEIVGPTVEAIVNDADVSAVVKQMLNDSEIFPDLIFTIGSSKDELANFVKMAKENPGKAIRYIALTESLINQELEGKAAPADPPAKPQTAAPKPPSEVGGRAATPGDALAEAAKANDFRSFKAEATRRELARLKG